MSPNCSNPRLLGRGAIIDWSPYPFVDVTKYGYGTVLINLAVILLIGLAFAAGFVFLDKRLPWAPRR